MRVLVTGGAGFIGAHTVDRLASYGHDPVIFDRYDRGGYGGRGVILGDVRDAESVHEAMSHVDGWIHLAACLGTQETINNPKPAAETNIMGGLNVLEAASQHEVPGVYIGVGNHWMDNTYSITKTTIERFVKMFNEDRGTRVNVVRAMNAYGPGQVAAPPFGLSSVRKITPSFVCRAIKGLPLEVYGDGSQVSDMVYVTDVSRALVLSLEAADRGQVFDGAIEVGSSLHFTVQEFAELIIKAVGSDSVIKNLPMRPGEVEGATVSADLSTLSKIGMAEGQLVPIELGVSRTIDYFRGVLEGV